MPTTQAFLEALSDERSILVQQLAFGDTLKKTGDEVKETARAVGMIEGLTIPLEDIEVALQQQWAEAEERKKAAAEGEEEEE